MLFRSQPFGQGCQDGRCRHSQQPLPGRIHHGVTAFTDVYKRQVLSRAGRDEQAMMTTLAGLVVVLMMVVREIADLFDLVKTLFHL